MPDKTRNTIVDLTAQIGWIEGNDYHKFPGWQNVTDAMREAVALLKEQEAAKPKRIDGNEIILLNAEAATTI